VTPVDAAHAAAEAVGSLNYATLGGTGYVWPADVDAVLVELASVAHRLPQAVRQAATWLEGQHAAGRMGHDQGENVTVAVYAALAELDVAVRCAGHLAKALDQARRETAHLTGDPS
jgi:malonyl CoA-acyl carrier protein transacylase